MINKNSKQNENQDADQKQKEKQNAKDTNPLNNKPETQEKSTQSAKGHRS